MKLVREDWTNKFKHTAETEKFKKVKEELCIAQRILLKGAQIVIPQTLQERILNIVHENHMGIIKSKQLLRTKVWWPRINTDIEGNISQHVYLVN